MRLTKWVALFAFAAVANVHADCVWTPAVSSIYQACGTVGIGKTPSATLDVKATGAGGATILNVDGDAGSMGYRVVVQDAGVTRFRIAPQGWTLIDAVGSSPGLVVNHTSGLAAELNGSVSVGGAMNVTGDAQSTTLNVFGNNTGGATLLNINGGPNAAGYRLTVQDQGINRFRITQQGNALIDGTGADSALIVNYVGSNSNAALINGKLKVDGNIEVTGNINAKFQDMAEWVSSTEFIEPGSVVIVADSDHVSPSTEAYDTRVAGVVSVQPGIVLGESGRSKVMVATTGRVKVRVDASNGPIRAGDILVSSAIKGTAMKSEPVVLHGRKFHQPGTVIGKALGHLPSGKGEILVLLSMQ